MYYPYSSQGHVPAILGGSSCLYAMFIGWVVPGSGTGPDGIPLGFVIVQEDKPDVCMPLCCCSFFNKIYLSPAREERDPVTSECYLGT